MKPADWSQNTDLKDLVNLGKNNITSVRTVSMTFVMQLSRNPDIDEKFYSGFEDMINENLKTYKEQNKNGVLNVYIFNVQSFIDAVSDDIDHDFTLIFSAIILVGLYTFLFLGNFSPINCRCLVALTGLICVALAYTSGFGLMYYCGGESTGVHQLMPFLLIGIGVDDMFVICNSVDQTDLNLPA